MDMEKKSLLLQFRRAMIVVQTGWRIENRSEIRLGGMIHNTDVSLIRTGRERGCSQIPDASNCIAGAVLYGKGER